MNKKYIFTLLCSVSVCAFAEDQKQVGITIEEAMQGSYNNKKNQTAREQTKAVHEKFVQARSGFLPQVNLQASHSRTRSIATQRNNSKASFDDGITKSGGVNLKQNLFNGGSTWHAMTSADAQVKKSWAELEKTEQENFKDAATVFLKIIAAQKSIDIAKGNNKFLQQQYESAKEKHKVGEETVTNVSAAEAELYKGLAEYEASLSTLESLKEEFTQTTTLTAPSVYQKPDVLKMMPVNLETAKKIAIDHHYGIKAAKAQIDVSQAEANKIASGLLPKIDVDASATRDESNQRNRTPFSTNFTITTSLSMPLYEGGQVRSAQREQLKNTGAAKVSLQNTIDELQTNVTAVWIKVQSLKNTLSALEKVVSASKRAVNSLTEEQKAGSKTLLDVLQQQTKYFQAQKQFVETEQDYLKTCYELLAAMGVLNAKKLNLKVDHFDAKADYDAVRRQF